MGGRQCRVDTCCLTLNAELAVHIVCQHCFCDIIFPLGAGHSPHLITARPAFDPMNNDVEIVFSKPNTPKNDRILLGKPGAYSPRHGVHFVPFTWCEYSLNALPGLEAWGRSWLKGEVWRRCRQGRWLA